MKKSCSLKIKRNSASLCGVGMKLSYSFTYLNTLQRARKRFVNLAKQDPGRSKQNSQETAGTNFTKPRTSHFRGLCIILILSLDSVYIIIYLLPQTPRRPYVVTSNHNVSAFVGLWPRWRSVGGGCSHAALLTKLLSRSWSAGYGFSDTAAFFPQVEWIWEN